MRVRIAFVIGFLAAAACGTSATERLGSDRTPDTGHAGYCRTTTCEPPDDYPHADGQCEPVNWSDSQTCVHDKKASNAPIFWRTACVGYDLNVRASRHVTYDAYSASARAAFGAWTGATCETDARLASRVSIDVRDLGPVACDHAAYDKGGGPNQNVIVFHDDAWPYEAHDIAISGTPKSLVVALTTVTFDPQTGEIFDADIELNSADYTIEPLDAPPATSDTFDLQTILTHETGHFLGLAHSPSPSAVMYASGDSNGSTAKRALTANDVRGICAIYPPNATRSVSTLVDPSGRVPEGACDATPRHGFTATCN
jgi:hypothetical protein